MIRDELIAGKYRVNRLIGAGAMAEVYEGTHLGIGKRIAIKRLTKVYAEAPEAVVRFRREARAIGGIESDYIVQVFDAGCDPSFGLYMVTELLVGEDLGRRLERERTIDPTLAATIGYQVARGLAKAHAAGVIHRDLKPANIFLAERDDGALTAKILDFGVSKLTLEDHDECETAVGVTLGTPQYMSPEQAQANPLDGRTDIWSLAATLYEALSGRPAHHDDASFLDVLWRVVHHDPLPLAVIAPWVPTALRDAVHAGLARDRELRPSDAAAFARRIADAMPGARLSMSGAQPVPVANPPAIDPTAPAPLRMPESPDTIPSCPVATHELEPPPSSAGEEAVAMFRRGASTFELIERK